MHDDCNQEWKFKIKSLKLIIEQKVKENLKNLIPEIEAFWPNAGKIHLDGYKIITNVDGYQINISDEKPTSTGRLQKLFFINLGGYKENEFEEFHYKILSVATEKSEAINAAKKSAFYKHTGFGKKAMSHIDDKYGIDVDDAYAIDEILSAETKEKFSIQISASPTNNLQEDELHLGYFKLSELK